MSAFRQLQLFRVLILRAPANPYGEARMLIQSVVQLDIAIVFSVVRQQVGRHEESPIPQRGHQGRSRLARREERPTLSELREQRSDQNRR